MSSSPAESNLPTDLAEKLETIDRQFEGIYSFDEMKGLIKEMLKQQMAMKAAMDLMLAAGRELTDKMYVVEGATILLLDDLKSRKDKLPMSVVEQEQKENEPV